MLNRTTRHGADAWLTMERVGTMLVRDGLIRPEQLGALQVGAPDSTLPHPLVRISEMNWRSARDERQPLELEWLTRWLATQCSLEYIRIDPLKIDVMRVTGIVSYAYARRFRILPVRVSDDSITIASAEPFATDWIGELSGLLRLRVEHVICNPLAVERYLTDFYSVSRSLSGATAAASDEPVLKVTNLEQLVDVAENSAEPGADDRHIVRLVDWLLQFAFEQRASDIHLEPRREQGNIRFRIDGVMHLVHHVQTVVLNAMVSRLKALGRMDVIERRRPQDGRVKTRPPNGHEIELRLSTMPTTFGEKLVMRIFDPEVLVRSIDELGLVGIELNRWRALTEAANGMLIVTGPTGSGKTTTLYSALKQLARPELNVCTIEDPIEMVDPSLNQMAVQPSIGVSFATGIRTLLRQDPDIIMVGEIRDKETADAALQAAMTGHLVLTTLHTNDAPSSVTRLLDLGVAPFLLRAALLGVIAQRLVRTLCDRCKAPVETDLPQWEALTAPHKARAPEQVYTAVGCDECRHTGYRGRIGIYEMMPISESLRQMIEPSMDIQALRAEASAEGMRSLRLSGALKVQSGITTPAEVFAVAPPEGQH
ncbi:MAG: ATPase, T2SS/T4P/T4SS family [Pseudomonadota bacterium]